MPIFFTVSLLNANKNHVPKAQHIVSTKLYGVICIGKRKEHRKDKM